MSDEIIQDGSTRFVLHVRFSAEERKRIEDRLNERTWKINSSPEREWGASKKAGGKYFCRKCRIRTGGIIDTLEDTNRRCPICRSEFIE